MPTISVKESGAWQEVKEIIVKDSGVWKPVKEIYTKDSGVWRKTFPETGSTSITSGTGSFTIPNGARTLTVSYPTPTAIITTILNDVSPGSTLFYNIGDFGSSSTFGPIVAPAYNTKVLHWESEVDGENKFYLGVATTGASAYSGSGSQATLNSGAQSAGCFYQEYDEWGHGDQIATIAITTVKTETLLNSTQVVVNNFSGRGGASVSILEQPSSSNSYKANINAYDSGYSQWYQSWDLYLQQKVPFIVSW